MPKKTIETKTVTQSYSEENVEPTREEKISIGMIRSHSKRRKSERDDALEEVERLKVENRALKKEIRAMKKEK